MKYIKINVKGRVQGVGFRMAIKNYCDDNAIKGFVRNLNNGGVEIAVQCGEMALDKFVKWLKENQGFSKVENLRVEEIEEENFNGFEIRRNGNFFMDQGKAVSNLGRKLLKS